MAELSINLTECFKAFLEALTTTIRAQLRSLLATLKAALEAKLAMLKASINRNDITAQVYKQVMDTISAIIAPVTDAMNSLPISNLSGCVEGSTFFDNIQKSYADYIRVFEDYAFKYAQMTFISTYTNKLQEAIQNQIDKIGEILTALDEMALGSMQVGSRVRNYENNQLGTITATNLVDVTVTILQDDATTVTVGASSVGVVNQ